MTQSDRVREIVKLRHVEPARRNGLTSFTVLARDVLREAEASEDFPRARTPLICNVLQSKKLLDENQLEIERVEGPPSRQSRRVIVHYRLRSTHSPTSSPELSSAPQKQETAEQWVERVIAPLIGLMKAKIKQHGGTEGYMRWVRGTDEDEA